MTRSEGPENPIQLRLRVLGSIERIPPDRALKGVVQSLHRLCSAVLGDLDMDGAAVHLMAGSGTEGVLTAAGDLGHRAAELLFTLGEGPALEAVRTRRPVLVADLESRTGERWPGYTSAALRVGVRAAFAIPLHVGAVSLAVLELYRGSVGALSAAGAPVALTYADVATGLLLEPAEQLRDRHLDPGMARALDYRAEVARAQGMVMVDLGVGLAEALVLLRAHAFAGDVMLIDLARRVISGYRLPGPDDAGSGLE